MSGLNRLAPTSDLADTAGRAQLNETLDVQSNAIRLLQEAVEELQGAPGIAPDPIAEYPLGSADGPVTTGYFGLSTPSLVGLCANTAAEWPLTGVSQAGEPSSESGLSERTTGPIWGPSAVGGGDSTTLFVGTLPKNFSGWGPKAITISYRLSLSGLTPFTTLNVDLRVNSRVIGSTQPTTTVTQNANGAGVMDTPYPQKISVTREQLAASASFFKPGQPIELSLVVYNRFSAMSGGFLRIGRIELDWR